MIDADMYGMIPKAKNGKAGQRTTREHVEETQYASLLPLEQLLKLNRVYAGHRDVRTNAVHHQSQQKEHQTATQIAEFIRFIRLRQARYHKYLSAY